MDRIKYITHLRMWGDWRKLGTQVLQHVLVYCNSLTLQNGTDFVRIGLRKHDKGDMGSILETPCGFMERREIGKVVYGNLGQGSGSEIWPRQPSRRWVIHVHHRYV